MGMAPTATLEQIGMAPELIADVRAGKKEIAPIFFPPYQTGFLGTTNRYPALIAGVGTGKTRMALQKMHKYCSENKGAVWIVIRKEFRDLQDSTMPDFERYFSLKINSNRNYIYPNGSRIMFRHGEEVQAGMDDPNVLKNINLAGFIIEQSEEFLSDKIFTFLRDRLRLEGMPYHQGIIIGNVKGHNWIWKIWKMQMHRSDKYVLFEATTYDNAANLPADFISDLDDMKKEAPAHFRRYVLNDWDEEEGVDVLIPRKIIELTFNIPGLATGGKILTCDPARSESVLACETAIAIFQRIDDKRFAQTHGEAKRGWDTMQTVGRIMNILNTASEYSYENVFNGIVIDSNGLGGGVYDRLKEMKNEKNRQILKDVALIGYNSGDDAVDKKKYFNARAEDTWGIKKKIESQELRLLDDEIQTNQLSTLMFDYKSDGARYVLSKKEMAGKGLPSPDRADRIIMADRFLQMCGPARVLMSPEEMRKDEFWKLVNADIKRESTNEDGWHEVDAE